MSLGERLTCPGGIRRESKQDDTGTTGCNMSKVWTEGPIGPEERWFSIILLMMFSGWLGIKCRLVPTREAMLGVTLLSGLVGSRRGGTEEVEKLDTVWDARLQGRLVGGWWEVLVCVRVLGGNGSITRKIRVIIPTYGALVYVEH